MYLYVEFTEAYSIFQGCSFQSPNCPQHRENDFFVYSKHTDVCVHKFKKEKSQINTSVFTMYMIMYDKFLKFLLRRYTQTCNIVYAKILNLFEIRFEQMFIPQEWSLQFEKMVDWKTWTNIHIYKRSFINKFFKEFKVNYSAMKLISPLVFLGLL